MSDDTTQRTLSEELEERFVDLVSEIERIDENTNGVFAKLSELRGSVEDLEARLDGLEERLDEVATNAEMAYAVSARGPAEADGGPTKAGRARRLSRDEVIRATADGVDAGARDVKSGERNDVVGAVTVSDVQDMARPRTELKWKTVAKDAWPALVEEWPCFRVEEPSDGSKRLTVDPDEVPVELARLVERSLEREDIANSVVGGREAGGA
jgi:outer membrane murein-binding lipoprotein Lpp